jgi:1,2-phenylacetyl-CoA epoxidase catalytic subunit
MSSMTQDEWGHARLLYAMLKPLGRSPKEVEHDRATAEYASIAALDEQAPDWAALVAMITLADRAIAVMLESFSSGGFELAQTRIPKMVAEEEFHSSLGAAWFKRLASTEGDARTLLTSAVDTMLPSLLAWVGADDAPMNDLVDAGLIGPADERVAAYRDAVREFAALVDVDADAIEPMAEWDEARGRTPGQLAEEAAERARGDRNRMLFVG